MTAVVNVNVMIVQDSGDDHELCGDGGKTENFYVTHNVQKYLRCQSSIILGPERLTDQKMQIFQHITV